MTMDLYTSVMEQKKTEDMKLLEDTIGLDKVNENRKPIFDSEGNVIESKYRGMYSFVHTEELRSAYDTYKVIHTLAKEGFKDMPMTNVTNVYVDAGGKRK